MVIFSLKAEDVIEKKRLKTHEMEISFKNVVYDSEFEQGAPKLFNISLDYNRTSFMKLLTGVGKDLLFIKLLLKIYTPTKGNINFGKTILNWDGNACLTQKAFLPTGITKVK